MFNAGKIRHAGTKSTYLSKQISGEVEIKEPPMKPKFTRGFILFAAALILMFVTLVLQPRTRATAPPPPAQTLTVTDCTSDTQLQAYIATANGESGDTINFSCSGTIPITSTLQIMSNMTLDGSGQQITLDGGGQPGCDPNTTSCPGLRVLHVSGATFTLNALTIANGYADQNDPSGSSDGAGLWNAAGMVTITNSTFTGNRNPGSPGHGGYGAGIFNGGPQLTITNSTFTNNAAGNAGAALATGSSIVTITNTMFTGNSITDPSNGQGGVL